LQHEYFFTNPMPAALCDMPKFPSSHEMTMKRARHEQRYGGGGQQRGQQQQQQQQRGQQQGQQGAAHYQQQQGGPAAQRQRTQGQYSGPQAPYIQPQPGQHRSGGAGQQPYRGGGGGIAPAAGAGMGGGAGMRMPVGGVAPAGIMPGTVLTQQQVQQMMAHGTGIVGMGMGMGLGMQAGAMQQPGASAGYAYAGQAPRPAAYGAPAGGGSHTGLQPHRAGGGALPMWQKERR
jgi:PAX-interacting protein 1